MPIHVGRAVSKYKEDMSDMIGDDTGDHISEKNPTYCELTAQYWAWKNLHDVDYIGFCHYHRFFSARITKRISSILKHHDVILIKQCIWSTTENDLLRYVSWEDVTIFLKILKKYYPEYEEITLKYLYGNIIYSKNMMICRKELFDQYAEWIFSLLSKCEKYMKLSPYSRERRALAYLGEYFMPVYILYHHYRIYDAHVVNSPLDNSKKTRISQIKAFFRHLHHTLIYSFLRKPESFEDYYCPAVLAGLKLDINEI
jgi:hypothetical protein